MAFSATAVANEFLIAAKAAGEKLTPMKLQKLVYFAHGWFLALTGNPLISQPIEAWQYGPVIPDLYREFKGYGNEPITELSYGMRFESGKMIFKVPTLADYPSTSERDRAKQIIGRVWSLYGRYSPSRLSNATHVVGSPWHQVYKDELPSAIIPDELIRSYFMTMAHEPSKTA